MAIRAGYHRGPGNHVDIIGSQRATTGSTFNRIHVDGAWSIDFIGYILGWTSFPASCSHPRCEKYQGKAGEQQHNSGNDPAGLSLRAERAQNEYHTEEDQNRGDYKGNDFYSFHGSSWLNSSLTLIGNAIQESEGLEIPFC